MNNFLQIHSMYGINNDKRKYNVSSHVFTVIFEVITIQINFYRNE